MVNWHDPALLLKEYRASCGFRVGQIALDSHLGAASNLNHAVAGIYL